MNYEITYVIVDKKSGEKFKRSTAFRTMSELTNFIVRMQNATQWEFSIVLLQPVRDAVMYPEIFCHDGIKGEK